MKKSLFLVSLVALMFGCDSVLLSGKVKDQHGNPVKSAQVKVVGESPVSEHANQSVYIASKTDSAGDYRVVLPPKFSGVVNLMSSAMFKAAAPNSRRYDLMTTDVTSQDFIATITMVNIKGRIYRSGTNVGEPNVTVVAIGSYGDQPFKASSVSGIDGSYSIQVPYGFSGTVQPSKPGLSFTAVSASSPTTQMSP